MTRAFGIYFCSFRETRSLRLHRKESTLPHFFSSAYFFISASTFREAEQTYEQIQTEPQRDYLTLLLMKGTRASPSDVRFCLRCFPVNRISIPHVIEVIFPYAFAPPLLYAFNFILCPGTHTPQVSSVACANGRAQ